METVSLQFKGIEIDAEGTYYEGEPMRMYFPDGTGHPGTPSEFEIEKITANGLDLTEILENDMEEIKELAVKKIES